MPMHLTTRPRYVKALARAERALEMRLGGATLSDIAMSVGFADKSGAHRAIKRQLIRTQGHADELTDELRATDNARLERMLAQLDSQIRGDGLEEARAAKDWVQVDTIITRQQRAIVVAKEILSRRAKLMGLDRPTAADIDTGTRSHAALLADAMEELDQQEEVQAAEAVVHDATPRLVASQEGAA